MSEMPCEWHREPRLIPQMEAVYINGQKIGFWETGRMVPNPAYVEQPYAFEPD